MKAQISAAVLVFCLMPSEQVWAFDCKKAATAVEKAICADEKLLTLDEKLNVEYAEVKSLSTSAEQKMLLRSQKRWISSRENCLQAPESIAACVKSALTERLKVLTGEPESGPGSGSRLIPVFAVQEGSAAAYEIDVALYRFADPHLPGEEAFNQIVDNDLGKLKFGQHGEDTMGHIRAIAETMTLSHVSPRLLSVRENFWSDEGGAHGNSMTLNHNIDLQSGKILEIGDILSEEAAAKLAVDCKRQIIAEKERRLEPEAYDPAADSFLKDDVIGEHIATLSRWSFSSGEASVSFDPYAIGPYAEGTYDCVFPMAALRAMTLETAPLP
jgi:uncharacterized protein